MLGSVLSGFMLAVNLLSRGGNNVWIPSNVRSLGCYSPFDLQAVVTNGAGSNDIGLSACFMCYTNFVLIRGVQCMCIEDRAIAGLIPVEDNYCDIHCDEISQPNNEETFMCGGNLGANLYCNKQAGNVCVAANSDQLAIEIYRDFGTDVEDDFQSMLPCLSLGCGRPETKDRVNLVYAEYFPNLNPEDCIIFCTYVKTSYAHAGWISSNNQMYPTCTCSNATRAPYPTDPLCAEGTCPPPLNPVKFVAGDVANKQAPSCGNQDNAYPNWSVFCTTALVKPANGTPYCAPFQSPYNSSWDACPSSTMTTQKTSSLSLTTQAGQSNKCQSRNKSQFSNVPRNLWGGNFGDNGNCANNSRFYSGSCYYTGSLSDNDMEDVDDWRKASAKYCNEMYDGHLLALETEEEKNFVAGEFLLYNLGDEGNMRPYLTSGMKTNRSTEYWSLPNDIQIPIANVSDWGVDLVNCDEDYPSFLVLYYEMDSQGYNSWQFTRDESSRHFVCEYIEPEDIETTSPSTTTLSSSTIASTTLTSTIASTTSTSTIASTTLTSTMASTTSTSTVASTTSTSTVASTTSTSAIPPTTSTSTALLTQISSTISTIMTSSTPQATSSSEETTATYTIISSTSAPPTEETSQRPTSTTKSTLVPESNYNGCPCVETDIYHVNWTIRANTTKTQMCRPGAFGMASWSCDLIANRCSLRTEQPNFDDCRSQELKEIADGIDDYDTELTVLWGTLLDFTQPNDTYFGHEIDFILDLVTDLLDRQDEQMNDTSSHLEFQINTTQTGVRILNNLISHDPQWKQLDQNNRSQSALLLLNVSEDMSFRLSDVAETDGLSLRCEIQLTSLTFSSSYWDGGIKDVYDCDLNAITASEVFRRFPSSSHYGADSTYLYLPEEAVAVGRMHKAAGLLISHYILQQLLPGQNSVAGDQKQINTPLISYSLRNDDTNDRNLSMNRNIPEGTFVQFFYQHNDAAKDPPVRVLHRDLDPRETPSPVVGSAFCAFISYDDLRYDGDRITWIWEGQGCTLVSSNRTHTICKCNHLTGFSALMDFHEYTGDRPLEITSYVCSLGSAISLAITFTVLTVLRSIKTDRTVITQHLCIFLMISHILILTTLDRHFLKLDDVTCAIMSVLLHFSLLVSFMWMGIEGVRLCRMVVYVFNLCDWTFYYILAANLVPFFIVGTTLLVAHFTTGIIPAYVGDETCWLNGENYKWSFAGPIAVIIMANVVFAIIAVRSSWNLKQNMDRPIEEKIRNAAALSLSLTCMLGISWLSGFFLYTETLVFAYIFTVTNGLQGVTIMLFRCILNDEVRSAIKERWRRHRNNRMGKWSSTMTNNTNSQRRQSVVGIDGKSGINRKLTHTNSRLSNLSNATKTTETTIVPNNRLPERMQRKNLRTFSGSEFSETEYSSGTRGSFSSMESCRHNSSEKQESTVSNGVRESRRVSFFVQEQTFPTTSLSSGLYEVNPNNLSESTSVINRRPGNLMFLEQDPSAFF